MFMNDSRHSPFPSFFLGFHRLSLLRENIDQRNGKGALSLVRPGWIAGKDTLWPSTSAVLFSFSSPEEKPMCPASHATLPCGYLRVISRARRPRVSHLARCYSTAQYTHTLHIQLRSHPPRTRVRRMALSPLEISCVAIYLRLRTGDYRPGCTCQKVLCWQSTKKLPRLIVLAWLRRSNSPQC